MYVLLGGELEGGATSSQQRSSVVALPGWAGPVLSVGTGAAVLAVLAVRLGAGPFLQGISRATLPALALALVLGALTTVLCAVRWVRAARLLGLPLPAAREQQPDLASDAYLRARLDAAAAGRLRVTVHHEDLFVSWH